MAALALRLLIGMAGPEKALGMLAGVVAFALAGTIAAGEAAVSPRESADSNELRAIPDQATRTWTDAGGDRHAQARLLAADGTRAQLEKSSGKIATIAIESLSVADRQYIHERLAARETSPDRPKAAASVQAVLAVLAGSAANLPSATMPPNVVYIRLSRPFLNRYLKHRVFDRSEVHDCILGVPISGTAQTRGRTELNLTPDSRRARIEVRLNGTADATTTGFSHPVWIFTHSLTRFCASKSISVDDKGIYDSPARTEARTQSTTTGIATICLRPLIERIVTRVAWRRVDESRPAAECITAAHVAGRINREVDRAASDSIAKFRSAVGLLESFSEFQKIKKPRMLSSTTGDYLQIVLLRDDAEERDAPDFIAAPVADPTGPDVEVAIHSAVIFAVLSEGQARLSFDTIVQAAWYQQLLEFSKAALAAGDRKSPIKYDMEWTDGGAWLRLKWSAKHGKQRDDAQRVSQN